MSLEIEQKTIGYMPFFYQRFAWSTRGWPAEATLAYLYLLCEQYSSGGLNPKPEVLDGIAPGTSKHWDLIGPKFFAGPDGLLRNIRCEEIRIKAMKKQDNKSELARLAALSRWNKGNANAMPTQCERNADAMQNDAIQSTKHKAQSQSQSNSETHTLNGSAVEPASLNDSAHTRTKREPLPPGALERLWSLFPRKVGKGKALALLERAIRDFAAEEEFPMDDACEVFREHIDRMAHQYRSTEPQYIPHPATWLAQRRYLDPIPEAR